MGAKHKQLMDAGGVSRLHLAVFQGKQEKVKKLLDKGSKDLNRGDKFGQTPLHIACHKEGLLECLKLLTAHNADLEALDANGNTALHSAAGSGAMTAAAYLLDRGLSVADLNKDGHTPLDICNNHCPLDQRSAMQALLEGGAKIQEEDRAGGGLHSSDGSRSGMGSHMIPPTVDKLSTPTRGSGIAVSSTRSLSTMGSDVGYSTYNDTMVDNNLVSAGRVSVPVAPSKGSAMGSVADNNKHNSGSSSRPRPLFPQSSSLEDSPRSKAVAAGAAAARGEHEQAKQTVAVRRGVTTEQYQRGPAAMGPKGEPSRGGRGEGVRGSGVGGLSLEAPSSESAVVPTYEVFSTPRRRAKQASLHELHLAIFQGDTDKVEEVVLRGDIAALNEPDKHGQTPLHLACYKGSRMMTQLLVEGGASLEAVDVNGNGVVHAAVCDSPAVLAILIDNGADVTLANHDGLTPKRLCEQYCPPRFRDRMLQLLKEAAAAQAKDAARRAQLVEGQMSVEAVYHQLAILRSKLASTAAARTEVPPSEAAETAQTENALLTLVEANVRVVEGQRLMLEELENTTGRLERMFRRLHMRLDALNPGDMSFT